MKVSTGLIAALVLCAVAGIVGTGCNTIRGAGKDIQKGGEAIEDAAENVRDDINAPKNHDHMIVASAESGGSINPPGVTGIGYGKSRTFTIKADSGYHVADVLVDGKSLGAVSRHTFDKPGEDHTIAAIFTPNPIR